MKNLKKTILTIMLLFAALVLVKPETAEAKPKTEIITKTYDIDKVSANDFVKKVQKDGVIGAKVYQDKKIYKIKLTTKAKSVSEGKKKIKAFAKKVKTAKTNTYGFSYGVKPDEYNSCRYDRKKKIYIENMYLTSNDIYYLNELTRKALKEPIAESSFVFSELDKNGKSVSTLKLTYVYMSDLFPDTATFKKCSDSVKYEFVANYIDGRSTNIGEHNDTFKWKYVYQEKDFGACHELALMEEEIVRAIASDYDYLYEANHRVANGRGHAIELVKVKRSDGTYDYFTGGDGGVRRYCTIEPDDDFWSVCKAEDAACFESWVHYRPEEYLNDKLEKEAYKYGKKVDATEYMYLVAKKGGYLKKK